MAGKTNDVAIVDVMNDDDALRNISSLSDALQVLNDAGITPRDSADYGNGFVVVPDKNQLVGKPFVILGAKQTIGDQGEFTILYVVTEAGEKFVVTDGGSGIHRQISSVLDRGDDPRMIVRAGLVRSDYEYVDADGVGRPATTYYLSGF